MFLPTITEHVQAGLTPASSPCIWNLHKGPRHPDAEDGRAIDVYSFAEEGHNPVTPGAR